MNTKTTPRILVVEDDESLRTVLIRTLKSAIPGSVIEWVTTADEGVARLERSRESNDAPYDLILCDMLLPNMELGTSLWQYCEQEMSETPFAFMSGMELGSYFKLLKGYKNIPPLLKKPFKIDEMKGLTRFLIDGTTGDAACS